VIPFIPNSLSESRFYPQPCARCHNTVSVLVWPDCVTQIVGTLRDSSGLLSGRLTVELDAPLIDTSTTPDTVYFPIAQVFTITNGAVDITLPQTEIAGITCRFAFSTIATRTDYYFADG
jgi:hypothetical protein